MSTLDRQAYLIIAHKNNLCFKTLLEMLDNELADIFIHMDSKEINYSEDEIKNLVKKSNVYFSERTKVSWGGYSQINTEILLLKLATETGKYGHYHLLSGADLPIKSQQYIIDFFNKHKDVEFIDYHTSSCDDSRAQLYWFFQEYIGRDSHLLARGTRKTLILLQKALHFRRHKDIHFYRGSNWFSITDSLARYVVSKKEWIEQTFKYTMCCDEFFLHTIVMNSQFKDKLYNPEIQETIRLIDWNRGKPYTFISSDLDLIKNSSQLFARKFNEDLDKDIIIKIKNMI